MNRLNVPPARTRNVMRVMSMYIAIDLARSAEEIAAARITSLRIETSGAPKWILDLFNVEAEYQYEDIGLFLKRKKKKRARPAAVVIRLLERKKKRKKREKKKKKDVLGALRR